ncbi:hypothetical protein G4V39_10685 [Thermosulfuriphilus ammonigenes]|uniref:Uncharacterized protein n=1 Tax=Thermosulfuriphilus ammonigenes TaxID=1936021 RepID=A0A6G7PZ83_9BACT|nr:PEP/pyruvate-binding domain-containing protein [Thermosulfuriphilus ammonigenes]MBA2849025.1 pyruvate,water dikinase [Thermosulfuriphilus ammonigenes]QIJ72713.1 hypothetical protein G4V39_10685 [Thermosulfuriphilus ammonigenes]
MESLVSLSSKEALSASKVGYKAARLARLACEGFPVPAGYVLTSRALREFFRFNGLNSQVENLSQSILKGCFPEHLTKRLQEALTTLGADVLAIRSSAVAEDTQQASMAGQLETFLQIAPDKAAEAIKACWASLFSRGARLYLAQKGLESASTMGVILQRQVFPLYSGVIFSLRPDSGVADELVCEWVSGLGDSLVSGRRSPQRIYLLRSNPRLPPELPSTLAQGLKQLIPLVFKAEEIFNDFLDIEWCLDQEGIFILQARPITTLTRKYLWSNVNIGENYPGTLTPFTWSIIEPFRYGYFHALFKELGLRDKDLELLNPVIKNLVGIHQGKVYYNLTSWYQMFGALPLGQNLAHFFNHYIGLHLPIKAKGPRLETPGFRFWGRLLCCLFSLERKVAAFEREFYRIHQLCRPQTIQGLDLEGLEDLLFKLRHFLEKRWSGAAMADAAAMIFPALLGKFLKAQMGLEPEEALLPLLRGLGLKSVQGLKMIYLLARRIEDHPLRDLLLKGRYQELERSLDSEARELLERFMFEFGGRCYHELMITAPTFEERRDLFWDLVRAALLSSWDPEKRERQERRQRQAFTQKVLKALPWRHRPLFYCLLTLAQQGISLRERARLCQSLIYGDIRQVVLRLGQKLTELGFLGEPGEIFFLEATEIHQLIRGKFLFPETLSQLVQLRQQAFKASESQKPPSTFLLPLASFWQASSSEVRPDGVVLEGLGVSQGRAQGRAKVIRDPARETLSPGEILVAPSTDPGWTSLFLMAGALVLERGGLLSHGAIVAREFGIPAVTEVKGACSLIQSGQTILVDGDQGRVFLLDRDENV